MHIEIWCGGGLGGWYLRKLSFYRELFPNFGPVDSLKLISSKSILIAGILISIVFTFFALARIC
jgi:hypothetical protein